MKIKEVLILFLYSTLFPKLIPFFHFVWVPAFHDVLLDLIEKLQQC